MGCGYAPSASAAFLTRADDDYLPRKESAMKQTHRTQRPLSLVRRFEGYRLEVDFLTAAYALVLPVLKRPLSLSAIPINQEFARTHHERGRRAGGARA